MTEHEQSARNDNGALDIFEFRQDGLNLFIDVSSPLMGLALRLKNMSSCGQVEALYEQVCEDIRNIDVALSEAKVEPALTLAYRYVLCAFLDEAVLATPWGADSVWGAQSLLSRFHNETWGGEKVFSILERLEAEPTRYGPLLIFIYQCLMLGFEGKFGVMKEGSKKREALITRLKTVIDREVPQSVPTTVSRHERIAPHRTVMGRQWTMGSVFGGFFLLWVVMFVFYHTSLSHQSAEVLSQLNLILS